MSQPADAKNSQPLSGNDSCLFQRPVHSDPGAKQRRGFGRRNTIRDFHRMACLGLHKLRVAPILGYAGDFLPHAEILISFSAELALAACPMNPRHYYAIADM